MTGHRNILVVNWVTNQHFPEYVLFIAIFQIIFKLNIEIEKRHLLWIFQITFESSPHHQTGLFTAAVVKSRVLCQPKAYYVRKIYGSKWHWNPTKLVQEAKKTRRLWLKKKWIIQHAMECFSDNDTFNVVVFVVYMAQLQKNIQPKKS